MSSPDKLVPNGSWSWYQSPSPVYSAADRAIYTHGLRADGSVVAYKITPGVSLQGSILHSALENDDHDVGAILPLANKTLLSAYGKHSVAGQFYRLSASPSEVLAYGAEGSLGASASTFANLWQSADAAGTIWNFVQFGSTFPQTLSYQSSTDGATWSGYTTLWSPPGTVQPLVRYCANGPNRLDFLASNNNPNLAASSLYHFYMTVASDGTPSWFNSAGVSLGAPPYSPATSGMTRVYDGSTAGAMPWDIRIIGGVPTVAFAVYPNQAGAALTTSSGAQHQYYVGQYTGGTWTAGLVAEAGTAWNSAARQDWLLSADPAYSPGICLDPNDATVVYLGRTNGGTAGVGATDARLEQWAFGGVWAKAADISGATGSLNVRPFAVQNYSPTQVLYWQASAYTAYKPTGTATVWTYPGGLLPAAKTSAPSWTASNAPCLGTQAYWLLAEGSGAQTKELVSGFECPFLGSPTWGSTGLGPQLSGFSTTVAVDCDGTASALAAAAGSAAGYPRFVWAAWSNGSANGDQQYVFTFGNSSTTQDFWALWINATSGAVGATFRDHSGTSAIPQASTGAVTDGQLHVLMLYSSSAGFHTLYLDGASVASNQASTLGSFTFQNLTIGAIRRNGVQTNPFLGQAVAAGWGLGSPDPELHYYDLISGRFGGTRAAASGGLSRRIRFNGGMIDYSGGF